jgi:ABC-type transporter Mla MlaB component
MAISGIFGLKNLCNFRAKIRLVQKLCKLNVMPKSVQNLCKLFAAESVPGD